MIGELLRGAHVVTMSRDEHGWALDCEICGQLDRVCAEPGTGFEAVRDAILEHWAKHYPKAETPPTRHNESSANKACQLVVSVEGFLRDRLACAR